MRFYTRQHRHYCGVDLHVKTMHICILDSAGQVLLHQNRPATPDAVLEAVAALSILAHKIGRAVVYMLSRQTVFSLEKFRAA